MRRVLAVVAFVSFLYSCSSNNITEDNSPEKFFTSRQLKGTFGIFDNNKGLFTVYNLPRFRDSTYLPASTFKIVNSLIGIEIGRVKDDSTVIPWDHVVRAIPEWNQDLMMKDAFKYSAVPWFQELARRIGKDTMQYWLDTIGYGREYRKPVITQQNLDTFWLDNSVKMSGDEQMGLVKRLYFDQLPFQKRSQRIVREMMLQENNSNYSLSYKTGWGHNEQRHAIGWIVAWIQENRHPYFFALQAESPDSSYDMSKARLDILKDILNEYGFMKGKK